MDELEKLKSQLKIARDEISNLRSQINSLKHQHRKDVEGIRTSLSDFRCTGCRSNPPQEPPQAATDESPTSEITFQPIGFIRTVFAEKRAVPRQANVAETILSRVELCKELYTNPEQSLEMLEDFSHFWIIWHFHLHRDEPHFKPKISPPRLDGKRVGVLATRSPHRPNPIGMSLVKLERIEGSTIYFYGADMVDQTPVIDIKPYIPQYDSPQKTLETATSASRSREEPEGEEEATNSALQVVPDLAESEVKVPSWISGTSRLKVIFSDNALNQIQELQINEKSIEEILENDPRSVYVREKYQSQIFSFQLAGKNVICKFDDKLGTVNVLQIRKLQTMTE